MIDIAVNSLAAKIAAATWVEAGWSIALTKEIGRAGSDVVGSALCGGFKGAEAEPDAAIDLGNLTVRIKGGLVGFDF